ncbi:ubiquitin carboxyl-terminal hydrolase 5 [Cimex lectularius]|uniref:Ubiquitin carboxyl-terminal hydrolase n=1 Tax=Cimex lectularius TaxID=79782 RepID=A0A8I6S3P6_CIMLE|nr:ubiquitin carboxyl-terminal hydrolase 5 [Cimex lectularius]
MSDGDVFGLEAHLPKVRIPGKETRVYKDECVFSFDTPDTPTGLYVCLNTFLGLGKDHVLRHYQKTGNGIFLHIKRDRIEKETVQGDGPERKVTKLAIGVEGGFDVDKKNVETNEVYKIVVLPKFTEIQWPCDQLPQVVINSVEAILEAETAARMAELDLPVWDGEVRQVSQHAASLKQLDNGKKVPPSGWKCEKCDMEKNLWLNLTDGSILCGRKYFDGSGGNEHALQHFKETGYPLAVKLGTITREGKGDVFSYIDDDLVEDPYLIQHLAHFGINIQNMEKTDKSVAELELDLNQKYNEWFALQEAVAQLKPAYGPGYTGLLNLGNSCYLNSVMQIIFQIPDFINKYYKKADEIFRNSAEPAVDFNVQMAKFATGLLSGRYSHPPPEGPEKKIVPPPSPHMFKYLIGRGHPDFSTKHQQDVHEFFLHLLTTVQRNSRGSTDPTEAFKLQVEDRIECGATKKVKYTHRTEYCLPLPIPLTAAVNKEEVEIYNTKKANGEKLESNEVVRPHIPFAACLEAFRQIEIVEQFYSSALGEKTIAKKTTRLATFPDYLVIHLKKFMMREDWVPVKLDVSVEMPDEVDLSCLKGNGPQPGEEFLPELSNPVPAPVLDQGVIAQLVEQGFPEAAAKKAVYFTKNQGIELAINWVLEHIGDSDFADPFVPPGTEMSSAQSKFTPNPEAVQMLMGMGFTENQVTKALKATDNNLERAADWIFSHAAELDKNDSTEESASSTTEKFRNGYPKYRLIAFISHMGTSTMVGHYVCHILKDGRWTIYNDEKVAFSENPPKNLGYMYMYQRV